MARHTTVRQRPASQEEDTFVASVVGATSWTRRNGRNLVIAAVVVVLAALGYLYWRNYRSALELRASGELNQIRSIAASGNLPLATRQLKQFVAKYGSTDAANEGRVMLAQALLDQNDAKGAIGVVQPLAGDLDEPLGPTAAFLLGGAYEAAKDLRQAQATYLRIADQARFEFQRRDALESAARLKLQNNDPAGAVQLYERIIAQMPDTAVGKPVYQMRLAEAQAEVQNTAKK